MRRAILFAALCAASLLCASTAGAQGPALAPEVHRQLDSLAAFSRQFRVEDAACVTSYAVEDGTTTIRKLGPASYLWADSVTIYAPYAGARMCAPGEPTIHSHIHGVVWPSGVDLYTKWRDDVPFAFILSLSPVGWGLVRY